MSKDDLTLHGELVEEIKKDDGITFELLTERGFDSSIPIGTPFELKATITIDKMLGPQIEIQAHNAQTALFFLPFMEGSTTRRKPKATE